MPLHRHLTLLAVLALWPCPALPAAAPAPLAADRLDALHRTIRPHAGELLWMKVPWETSITLARHRAAVENKPLLIMAVAGAGFSDPLGIC
jgi:hypothetical protein